MKGVSARGHEPIVAELAPQEEPMSATSRTIQVTLGIRHLAATIVAVAVALGLAAVVALGPLTAAGPTIAPPAPVASAFVDPVPAPSTPTHGGNGTRIAK
jgi:hypothetical protein